MGLWLGLGVVRVGVCVRDAGVFVGPGNCREEFIPRLDEGGLGGNVGLLVGGGFWSLGGWSGGGVEGAFDLLVGLVALIKLIKICSKSQICSSRW